MGVISPNILATMAATEEAMAKLPGKIVSQQTCPIFGAKGQYTQASHGRVDFMVCVCGGYMPTRFDIMLWWQGKSRRLSYDQNGNRFDSYQQTQIALGVVRQQIKSGDFYPELWVGKKSNMLLWENWHREYLTREKRRCTRANYQKKQQIGKYLGMFNGLNIREMRTAHVQDFATCEKVQKLSPKYQADILAELRHILQEAVDRDDLARAPKVPSVKVPRKRIAWLTPELQEAALQVMPEEHRPIFAFMFSYGCRPAEACALLWDCIDQTSPLADLGVFYLARTFSRRRLVENTKTKIDNELPITSLFAAYLDSIPRGLPEQPVFINPKAIPARNPKRFYTPDLLATIWDTAAKAAKIPKINLYNAVRHSRGMQAVNLEGWGLETVARLFGHTSLKHTQRYAATDTRMLAEKLDTKIRPLKRLPSNSK